MPNGEPLEAGTGMTVIVLRTTTGPEDETWGTFFALAVPTTPPAERHALQSAVAVAPAFSVWKQVSDSSNGRKASYLPQ